MKSTRPKNLNLFTIRFPVTAIVSILHRVSGFFIFLLIPGLLWTLDYSLTYPGFYQIQDLMSQTWAKILLWLLLAPILFHIVAGIRHLLADLHIGTTLKGGRLASYLTFIITFILLALAGVWLW